MKYFGRCSPYELRHSHYIETGLICFQKILHVIMDIPANLRSEIDEGKVVLALGAGASFDTKKCRGDKPPSGNGLRDLLADKYLVPHPQKEDIFATIFSVCWWGLMISDSAELGGEFKNADLGVVAGYLFGTRSWWSPIILTRMLQAGLLVRHGSGRSVHYTKR